MNQSRQQQRPPGRDTQLQPRADHGEESYQGCARLQDQVALITGGDSGIGRAVAIAFAREGADIAISYISDELEGQDASETADWVERAGRRVLRLPGDVAQPEHCRALVRQTVEAFGRIDILVNNAAFQMTHESLEEIPDEEWDRTFQINITAMFHLCKAAVPHMKAGSAIINTASVNADMPRPTLLAYAATKGAIVNFTGGLAQLLAERGIRANCVAPGPIWTPLIPSTMPAEHVAQFGRNVPMKRPGQPAEVAAAYVLLASDQASYISGACIAVTGGKPII